jgi:hypothetical protein
VNVAMTSQPPLATAALLTTLGLALLGIEAVTTLSGRVSSVSRPMGLAVAVIALCATTGWVAVARASSAVGLAFDESWIVLLNADFFDSSGGYWLVSGSLALGSAALLAITLAAVRVAARLTQQITHRQHIGAVTIGAASVMSLLVLVVTQDWGGTGSKLVFVAPLLLLAVYMAVAEANSRLPGSGEAAMAVRVLMPALTVLIVLVLLQYYDFDATLLWSIALAAATVAVAAITAFRVSGARNPSRQRLT